MNPIATIIMENGQKIILELLPEFAPNTVNSFISLVNKGCYDGHAIQRIVPGSWIDVSYTGFNKEACRYLIENDLENSSIANHPQIKPGTVIMGGYGREKVSGSEFVFPLRECPELQELYPVFAYVREGMEEIFRLEKVKTFPVDYKYDPNIVVNCPIEKQIIKEIKVETYHREYEEPKKLKLSKEELPKAWFDSYPDCKE